MSRRQTVAIVVGTAAAVAFAAYFASHLGQPTANDGPSAIVLEPPADFVEIRLAEDAGLEAAARAAEERISSATRAQGIAARFTNDDAVTLLLVDPARNRITTIRAASTGTLVGTEYDGDIATRLASAAAGRGLAPAGLTEPRSHNMYH